MKKFLVALLVLAGASADSARFGRVAVVLSAQGTAGLHKPGEPASRLYPLQTLDSLDIGQTLKLEPKAVVTLSVLSSGIRYRLTGPLSLPITETLKTGQELPKQAGRAGLAASQQVDLSKFGGGSSRDAFPIYTDGPGLVLDLDVLPRAFEASSLKVFYRPEDGPGTWTPVESSLFHHSNNRDQLRLSANFEANQRYLVYIGDKTSPDTGDAQFRVLRLPEAVLAPVHQLEKSASDWPGQIELYESYNHLRLFAKAEPLLEQMRKEHPQGVNWPQVTARFNENRRRKPKGP